ncbi:tRNA guanosine(34) transglycosylase Tgt [Ktedonosporobacter rubrisoli]|uniref:tRNA guanosine(34) transglycosylase Tgt n=1 Tax=Ktedonosporobacter rubrisoli TaxID=2509675 RepID=A0A4P6JVU1_KTERU|nr:tRNA guanosine(34) transglycosylase Tgt [Ktedonosporobacter rubrisoli]QBD79565.1 tRNA guanosine(34) transglycosylase Tgt [Ktedonosporobacter rubrisoli]
MDQALSKTPHEATATQQQYGSLQLPHGQLQLPVYMPDATLGVVRSIDSSDLERHAVQAVVMNTFHLMQHPGSSTVQALGGLHTMSSWPHPIVTDSGGFQAYSLIQQNARFGSLDADGISFKPEGAERKFHLTPEKAVQLQMSYDTDVVMCLDYCTHVDAPFATQEEAVLRTIAWAKRCKSEFVRLVEQKRLAPEKRPHLFGVIQGGGSHELRKRCAEALLEIGFDGYGYGGWPLDAQGKLLTDIIGYTRELIPAQFPMHALGVGHPDNVVECTRLGYGMFDSAMPTRDARHARLYVFNRQASEIEGKGKWFSYVYINDDKYIKDSAPISNLCDCLSCTRYTRAYLRHLFKVNDSLFFRLATIHNLRFMTMLTQRLREGYYARG